MTLLATIEKGHLLMKAEQALHRSVRIFVAKSIKGYIKPGHKYIKREGQPGDYRYTYRGKKFKGQYGQVANIPLILIKRNPNQPRQTFELEKLKELATSIEEKGLKIPIKLRPKGKGFEIVSGERRYRAHQMLKKETMRAIVERVSDREMAEEALLENISRENLNPIEEGKAYNYMLQGDKWTIDQLAKITGHSTSYIRSMQSLAGLIPEATKYTENGSLKITMALKIAQLEDPNLQRVAFRRAVKGDLSTQEFGLYVTSLKAEKNVLPLFGGQLEEVNKLPEGITKRKVKSIAKKYNEIFNKVAGLVRRTISAKDYKVYAKILQGDLTKRIQQLDLLERSIRKIRQDLIQERSRRQIITGAQAGERLKQIRLAKSITHGDLLNKIEQRITGLNKMLKILLNAIPREGLAKSIIWIDLNDNGIKSPDEIFVINRITGERVKGKWGKHKVAKIAIRKNGRLFKAVITTPTSASGKVDYKRVPVGASIWVTITDESSPLHGRHILITKRPDQQFALTGGSVNQLAELEKKQHELNELLGRIRFEGLK